MQPVIPRTTSGRALPCPSMLARANTRSSAFSRTAQVLIRIRSAPRRDRRCARSRRDRAGRASDRCRRRSSGSRRSRGRPCRVGAVFGAAESSTPRARRAELNQIAHGGGITRPCTDLHARLAPRSCRCSPRSRCPLARLGRGALELPGLTLPASRRRASTSAWATATTRSPRQRRLRHEPRAAGGVAHDFELGFRLGFRLDDGGQATQADSYGRPFDTETYGTEHDRIANPELKFRWSMARSYAAELGLELRAYIPIETQSRFGFMIGLPIALRAGPSASTPASSFRSSSTTRRKTVVSIPLHIWIQPTATFWLGPLLGMRVVNQDGSHTQYPLGFGLGWQLNRAVDLRTWFMFPDINQDAAARTYGLGVGARSQVRVARHSSAGEAGFEGRLRHRAADLIDLARAAEDDHRRDRLDLEAGGAARVLVDVQLRDLQLARALAGERLEHRRDGAARPAPGRPEVDQHRDRRVLDLLLPARVGDRHRPAREDLLLAAPAHRVVAEPRAQDAGCSRRSGCTRKRRCPADPLPLRRSWRLCVSTSPARSRRRGDTR